jgi:hypothetical protein
VTYFRPSAQLNSLTYPFSVVVKQRLNNFMNIVIIRWLYVHLHRL